MANGQGLAGAQQAPPTQAPPQQIQAAPGNVQGGDPQMVLQALKQAVQASVDQSGYVDIKKLATIWPQVAQQVGLNIPFEAVLQMIQQNPDMIRDLVVEMGLAGISVDGKQISAEQLAGIGSGAAGAPQPGAQPVAQGGAPQGGLT